MNRKTKLGSRIAEVHNGSSLFTGDAGQGESNIRRWIITNDWLEAIIALPLNMFYNTPIATYIWILSNKKSREREGKIQLIDATQWFKPLRRNLGKKNRELSEDDIRRICVAYFDFQQTEHSKVFPNETFGYWKVTVERPLRLVSQLTPKLVEALRFASGDEDIRSKLYDQFGDALFEDFESISKRLEGALAEWSGADDPAESEEEDDAPRRGLSEKKKKKLLDSQSWQRDNRLLETATLLRRELGGDLFPDHNVFRERAKTALVSINSSLSTSDLKVLLRAVSWRDEAAPEIIAKAHSRAKMKPDRLRGLYETRRGGKDIVVEYEPDTELRDTEQVALLQDGGIEAYVTREVLPCSPDAWIDEKKTKIGYEINFARHFYKPVPLRSLGVIRNDIRMVEKEAEGLLEGLLEEARQV